MADLQSAFVNAYEPHVRGRIADLGISVTGPLSEAIEHGRVWLESALGELSGMAFDQQRRGPLELFQEAMRFPTGVLVESGAKPVDRDQIVANALPGDQFGLAPATSHDLGEVAWRAHLTWGAAKAAAMQGPGRVGLLTRNLMDSSKLDAALQQAGFERVAIRPGDIHGEFPELLDVAIVDLEHPSAMDAVAATVERGIECIAYGPHGDTEAFAEAIRMGAGTAIPRSRVLRDPAAFVATL